MGNNAWDQTIISVRERPLSSDINGGWSQENRTLRELLRNLLAKRASDASDALAPATGFIADGFRVSAQGTPAMAVNVQAGYGFKDNIADVAVDIGGALNLNDLSAYKPMFLGQTQSLVVPSADPSNPRIDIIEVKYDRRATDNSSRDVLNTGTGAFDPTLVDKTLAWIQDGRTSLSGSASINYKPGTPAGSPTAPAVTSGYTKIAEILVGAGVTTITQNKVNDTRPLLFANGGAGRVSGSMTLAMTGSPPAITINYLNAPPGVTVVFTSTYPGAGFTRYLTAWVIAGDIRKVSARAIATVTGSSADNTNMVTCELGSSISVIDGSAQTALAAATLPAAVAAAVGQRCALVSIYPKMFDGTTVAQPTSGGMAVDFDIDFQTS